MKSSLDELVRGVLLYNVRSLQKEVNSLGQVKFSPYSDVYREGTLNVLRRNYAWMSRLNDEKLYKWLTPIVAYKWHGETEPGDIPCKYGLVLLDDDNVVGFFGATYSYQNIGGKKRLYACLSTFAADQDYRFYVFPAVNELCGTADVITDFTPRESMRRLFVERFHFQCINDKQIIMYPVPSFSNRVKVNFTNHAEDINDPVMRKIFIDHEPYGVKCCLFERDDEQGCIFFSSKWRMRWKKRIPFGKIVNIFKVSSKDLFSKNLHEIAWKIQRHEGICAKINIDAAFLNENFSHPFCITKPVHRLMFSREEVPHEYDFMYSECSTLL